VRPQTKAIIRTGKLTEQSTALLQPAHSKSNERLRPQGTEPGQDFKVPLVTSAMRRRNMALPPANGMDGRDASPSLANARF
jgi:hypothetical protein